MAILKQAEVGGPVADLIRQAGISEQAFYRWKKQYVGLEVDRVRELRRVQEENVRLKRLVAELTLDKTMLRCCRMCWQKSCKALAAPPLRDLLREHCRVSERRVCRVCRLDRGSCRYRSCLNP